MESDPIFEVIVANGGIILLWGVVDLEVALPIFIGDEHFIVVTDPEGERESIEVGTFLGFDIVFHFFPVVGGRAEVEEIVEESLVEIGIVEVAAEFHEDGE